MGGRLACTGLPSGSGNLPGIGHTFGIKTSSSQHGEGKVSSPYERGGG